MAIVSISEASKIVRKGRQTLYNHNESGKLSFTKDSEGKVGIALSELHRVYGKLYMKPDRAEELGMDKAHVQGDPNGQNEAAQGNGMQAEIGRIRELLSVEKTERNRERRQAEDLIADLRKQRDKWEGQASSAMLRLEYQEKTAASKRRWFGLLPPAKPDWPA